MKFGLVGVMLRAQPAGIFDGVGQNDCKLLYLTTKHVFENFGEQLPSCSSLVHTDRCTVETQKSRIFGQKL